MSDLVGNPEDRFSHNEAQIISIVMPRTGSKGNETKKLHLHPLNMYLGRALIAEGVSKQNSHPFKVMQKRQSCVFWYGYVYLSYASYAYQSYWLCDRCDTDVMLKKSDAVIDVKV